MDSEIRGVSVRAILAMGTVFSGLAFLYIMAMVAIVAIGGEAITTVGLVIITAIIGFINLALGYYLGQKTMSMRTGANDTQVDTEVEVPPVNPVGREPT
jgi:hypothetical protein